MTHAATRFALFLGAWLSGGVVSLVMPVVSAQATGTAKVGPWVMITYDKPDGRRDAAAVVSAPRMPFAVGLRCIDGKLSVALIPQADDRIFGTARRGVTLSLQADERAPVEVDGTVGAEHAILLQPQALAPTLQLVLASRRIVISAPAASGQAVSSSLDLAMADRALADVVKHCPAL
ncbi:MAG TPA: hypothetical protein VGN82_17215 [Bosea sp. (in: a-proteobacteria)]|jgi:hypothetical protein|uniref:hypothetical protein n=1 Tax=Bosea sp. (in: a-proteobacteria) TaxID=1871050 RepID=UPI002E136478|nr:hypothetical protein [Bosea sp. (in: a-proteobacteria)]